MVSSLLAKLSLSLGSCQAAIELTWMRQAAHAPHDLEIMVTRRARGEPLQYILGTQPFGALNILTRPPTLIPRPETEQWTSDLADKLLTRWPAPRTLKVLDLCTGSGCIPLLLSHRMNTQGIQVAALGVDISQSACELARDNLAASSLSAGSSLDFLQINLFDDNFRESIQSFFRRANKGPTQLDVVTANPPYIPMDQWRRLPASVKDWEDPVALIGDPFPHGADGPAAPQRFNKGLTFYERIRDVLSYPGLLSQHSILAMEVGEEQAPDVIKIFDRGFGRSEIWKDWWGKERAVFIYGEEQPHQNKT